MTEKLTPEELRYVHQKMLDLYGGLPGEKEPGMMDYICEKPFFFGAYPTLFEKAAVIMIAIATGHYFVDGNKRTAAMSTYVFLMKNEFELIVSDDDLFEMAVRVAQKEINQESLTQWLSDNSVQVDINEL